MLSSLNKLKDACDIYSVDKKGRHSDMVFIISYTHRD